MAHCMMLVLDRQVRLQSRSLSLLPLSDASRVCPSAVHSHRCAGSVLDVSQELRFHDGYGGECTQKMVDRGKERDGLVWRWLVLSTMNRTGSRLDDDRSVGTSKVLDWHRSLNGLVLNQHSTLYVLDMMIPPGSDSLCCVSSIFSPRTHLMCITTAMNHAG